MTSGKIRLALWSLIGGAAALGTFAFAKDVVAATEVVRQAPTLALAAAMCGALLNACFRVGRWNLFLGRSGHRLPWKGSGILYVAGFAFTLTPGKAGEAARALLLKPFGVPHSTTVGLCIVERFLDVVVITALGILLVPGFAELAPLFAAMAGLLIAAFVFLRSPRVSEWTLGYAAQHSKALSRRLAHGTSQALSIIRQMLQGQSLGVGMILTAFGWVLDATGVWLLAVGFGADVSWAQGVGIYCASLLAGAVLFMPGGLVGTEITLIALLVAAGTSTPVAVAATLAARVCTLGLSVLVGAVALVWARWFLLPRAPEPA